MSNHIEEIMAEQPEPQNGTIAWNELSTRNMPECKSFYTKLLGWEAVDMDMPTGPYTIFQNNGINVGGMMGMTPEMDHLPSHWMGYIAVADIDATLAEVEGLGGKVLYPATDIPKVGRFSLIQDPGGAAIALITFVPMEK